MEFSPLEMILFEVPIEGIGLCVSLCAGLGECLGINLN
jgi:hypothetical protein